MAPTVTADLRNDRISLREIEHLLVPMLMLHKTPCQHSHISDAQQRIEIIDYTGR